MAQLEQAPRRATALTTGMVAVVAVVAAVAIAATILFGMLNPGRLSPATTQQGQESQVNPALVEAGREWQRQREQQGGFTDPLTQAGLEWEQQRKQQSPFDGE